jgi:hypothetical protein
LRIDPMLCSLVMFLLHAYLTSSWCMQYLPPDLYRYLYMTRSKYADSAACPPV